MDLIMIGSFLFFNSFLNKICFNFKAGIEHSQPHTVTIEQERIDIRLVSDRHSWLKQIT